MSAKTRILPIHEDQMPRPKTDHRWIQLIKQLCVNNERMTARAIARRLQAEPDGQNAPSERTVSRLIEEFESSQESKLPYKYFCWPGSMESGALPWEASRACLDLLRYFTDH